MYNGIFCGLTWITILPNDYQLGNKTDKKFNSLESHCRWITQVFTLLRNRLNIFQRFIHFIWSNTLWVQYYMYMYRYIYIYIYKMTTTYIWRIIGKNLPRAFFATKTSPESYWHKVWNVKRLSWMSGLNLEWAMLLLANVSE